MSLKDLISSLIAPLSARPTRQYQTIEPTIGVNANFTMPYDGWVLLSGGSGSNGKNVCLQLWGDASREPLTTTTTMTIPGGWSNKAIGFFLKGEKVFYNIDGHNNMKICVYGLVGGGGN